MTVMIALGVNVIFWIGFAVWVAFKTPSIWRAVFGWVMLFITLFGFFSAGMKPVDCAEQVYQPIALCETDTQCEELEASGYFEQGK